MTTPRRVLTTTAITALMTGGATAALASGGGRDNPEDDGTTTAATTTTPSPAATPAAPRIIDLEVDHAPGDRIRLRAEVKARGERVTSVRFVYRGTTYKATRSRGTVWTRTVTARGDDAREDAVVTFRVRACAGSRCSTRTGSDDA